jgi:hypothetical protein
MDPVTIPKNKKPKMAIYLIMKRLKILSLTNQVILTNRVISSKVLIFTS